jgi:iron complex transport system substrate-binding protein
MKIHGSALALAAAAALAGVTAAAAPPQGDPAGPPRTVADGAGREVVIPPSPERLIALAPSVSEMVYALGLGSRLVGVSDFCRIPADVPEPARVGGLINPDLEKIVSLRPDLAIATTSGNYLEDADRISGLGIPVYTCHTPTVDAVLTTLEELGGLLGATADSDALVRALRRRLQAVENRGADRPRPRVLFVIWGDPILVPGKGAFITDALARAGGESVSAAAAARWAEYGLEQIVALAPETILTVPDNRAFADSIRSDPRWSTVPAVRDGRIHVISDAIQQPGPRIVDAIEEIAAVIHSDRRPPGQGRPD